MAHTNAIVQARICSFARDHDAVATPMADGTVRLGLHAIDRDDTPFTELVFVRTLREAALELGY